MVGKTVDISEIYDKSVSEAEKFQSKVRNVRSAEKLREVSEEFEAIFVNLMIKEMRKNIGETGFLKSRREEIFRDFLYWEYSKLVAKNTSLGIAERIYELYKGSI